MPRWAHLPPASAAQAVNVLRAVGSLDPSKQLRELAAQLAAAVDKAIAATPEASSAPGCRNPPRLPSAPPHGLTTHGSAGATRTPLASSSSPLKLEPTMIWKRVSKDVSSLRAQHPC